MTNSASASTWQRARQPEQKQERRTAILDAAGRLLDARGIEGTGLNAIAREAGIAKANIYRYFESREAVLLMLLQAEVDGWTAALSRRLVPLASSDDVDAIAQAFASTIAKRRRLCVLLAALASVLEHNVGADGIRMFKRNFLRSVEPAVTALAAAVPSLSVEEAFSCLAMLTMTAAGAWPHCHPSAAVEEVLAEPEFAAMRLSFQSAMQAHAAIVLRGLLSSD